MNKPKRCDPFHDPFTRYHVQPFGGERIFPLSIIMSRSMLKDYVEWDWDVCVWFGESKRCGELHWVQVGDWSWAVRRAVYYLKERMQQGRGAIIVTRYIGEQVLMSDHRRHLGESRCNLAQVGGEFR